jgi:two-component system NtrC family response regulator
MNMRIADLINTYPGLARLASEAIRAIRAHRWPGNVRELENRIKGAVIMAEGAVVTAGDLGLEDPGDDPECINLRVAHQRAAAQAVTARRACQRRPAGRCWCGSRLAASRPRD